MPDNNKYFGAARFSPREMFLLRLMRLEQILGGRYLRFRYRDRMRMGRR
jgi:hypothetical protein